MYGLRKIYKFEAMDIQTKIQLFDSIITPILLYGTEVWGLDNVSNIEKIQIRFYKSVFFSRQFTGTVNEKCVNVSRKKRKCIYNCISRQFFPAKLKC